MRSLKNIYVEFDTFSSVGTVSLLQQASCGLENQNQRFAQRFMPAALPQNRQPGSAARASTSLNSWQVNGCGALDARPPSAGSHEAVR